MHRMEKQYCDNMLRLSSNMEKLINSIRWIFLSSDPDYSATTESHVSISTVAVAISLSAAYGQRTCSLQTTTPQLLKRDTVHHLWPQLKTVRVLSRILINSCILCMYNSNVLYNVAKQLFHMHVLDFMMITLQQKSNNYYLNIIIIIIQHIIIMTKSLVKAHHTRNYSYRETNNT